MYISISYNYIGDMYSYSDIGDLYIDCDIGDMYISISYMYYILIVI